MIINGEASDDKSSSYDLFYIIKLYLSQMCLHQPQNFKGMAYLFWTAQCAYVVLIIG